LSPVSRSPPLPILSALFFFFSSRRRHTRSKRDWSSDVCSSDLVSPLPLAPEIEPEDDGVPERTDPAAVPRLAEGWLEVGDDEKRSEERRVGKECRYRGTGGEGKKKRERSRTAARSSEDDERM